MWFRFNSNIGWKELLELRLEDLGWTLYKLAKKYAEITGEENSPATRYHSAIGKFFEEPERSKLKTVENVIKALGGEIIIIWDNTDIESIKERMFKLKKCTTNQLIKEISRRAEEMCPPELIKPTYPNCLKNKHKFNAEDIAGLLNNISTKKYKDG